MKLFLTKEEALAAKVEGEVCIGFPKIHSVCNISNGVIRYIWTRTFWDK